MAFAINSSRESAFLRAKELLRKETALTHAECEELVELFDKVSGMQFVTLTQDPQHKRALREYDRYTWRPAIPILAIMTVLLVFSLAIGICVSMAPDLALVQRLP